MVLDKEMSGFGYINTLLCGRFLVYNVRAINLKLNKHNQKNQMTEQTAQANFKSKGISKLLNSIQEHPSEESDELTAIVLKMGLDLVAKKPKPPAPKENILKFTNKEIDEMSEPVKILFYLQRLRNQIPHH